MLGKVLGGHEEGVYHLHHISIFSLSLFVVIGDYSDGSGSGSESD
jgi:hypothetical protein